MYFQFDEHLRILEQIGRGGMLCPGRLAHLGHYALETSGLNGEMVEFGCYKGHTGLWLSLLTRKRIWLYDSFSGLPKAVEQDNGRGKQFQPGRIVGSKEYVENLFTRFPVPQPRIISGWFGPHLELPDAISFAHLDADFYLGILDSIRLVYPRLVAGGVCVIDDYNWDQTPGVKAAADEYMADKPEPIRPLPTGQPNTFQAVIVKGTH